MNTNRMVRTAVAVVGLATVLATAACGQRDVTFQPQAATGSTGTAPAGGASSSTAAATPSDVVVTTQGSTICISRKGQSGQACVSSHGTSIVNGVTVVDGKVVSVDGSGADAGGGVVVNGATATPVPTSGEVTLSGASTWKGTAHGECYGSGTSVRQVNLTLGGGATLHVQAVGGGVAKIELQQGSDLYSGNWVGDSGIITLADKSLTVNSARLGKGSQSIQVSGTVNC
jgi:hypothetical protein